MDQSTIIKINLYDNHLLTPIELNNDTCDKLLSDNKKLWIEIRGLKDKQKITDICLQYGVHPLIIKDIFSKSQRYKIEILDNYVFCVVGILHKINNRYSLNSIKYNILVFDNLVITISTDNLDKEHITTDSLAEELSKIKKPGTDYLLYLILNHLAEYYYNFIEVIMQNIEEVEKKVFDAKEKVDFKQIYMIKRKILLLNKLITPIADISDILCQGEIGILNKENKIYFMNLFEQTSRSIQSLNFYQQLITSICDIYLSTINTSMNQSVTTMTKYAIIGLPLTVITSFFGMNLQTPLFSYMFMFPLVVSGSIFITYLLYRYYRPTITDEPF